MPISAHRIATAIDAYRKRALAGRARLEREAKAWPDSVDNPSASFTPLLREDEKRFVCEVPADAQDTRTGPPHPAPILTKQHKNRPATPSSKTNTQNKSRPAAQRRDSHTKQKPARNRWGPARARARPDVSVRRVKSEALAVALRIWAAASDDLPLKGGVMDKLEVRVRLG